MGERIIKLLKEDLELILDLEKNSWLPSAQANEKSILKRLDLGHTMLGLKEDKLIGMVSFSYAQSSPNDYKNFPKTFNEFSTKKIGENYNSGFFYNLAIHPEKRGGKYASFLIKEAIAYARNEGCIHLFADGRCPSYNGSNNFKQEKVKQSLEFKKVIDRYVETNIFPEQKEFLNDFTLAFYHKLLGCKFLWIMPDFFPEDKPSGGFRVIFHKDIGDLK